MEKSTNLKDFQVLYKLGQGAFGQVFKVKRKVDNQIYAMKKIKLSTMKQKQKENALNEVRILASNKDEYIIGYKQCFYDDPSSTLCIVMEFASGGDLLKQIQTHLKNKTKFAETQIWKALVHITQGLRSLHEKKILHRDLKCANLFITGDGVYKLGDLNVSKVLKKDLANTQTGTPYYASPEVWKSKPYGVKSDMWSLGCVLYEMAALKPPFTATDLPGLYKKICTGLFPPISASYSTDLSKVITSLLKLNHYDRPNTIQLLENPVIHKMYKGVIDAKARQQQQDDFLLKTLKLNNRRLPLIKNILPKANYEGELKTSRSRINSIERIKTQTKQTDKLFDKLAVETPKIQQSLSLVINKQKQNQQKLINNYLELKRKHEAKERQRLMQNLKNQKDNLIRKRQRILSAGGMRLQNQYGLEMPSKIKAKEKIDVLMTPLANKKEAGLLLPAFSNKNLPPKPICSSNNPSINYKMPPKPTPLISSKQSNSIDYSHFTSREKNQREKAQREKSKQGLMRANQHILMEDGVKHSQYQPKKKIVRSSSAQKV